MLLGAAAPVDTVGTRGLRGYPRPVSRGLPWVPAAGFPAATTQNGRFI